MFPGRRTLAPAPRTRIELHAHLDGCVRHETIWELMRSKKMKMPGDGTFHALQEALVVRDPVDLAHFLEPFNIFSRAIARGNVVFKTEDVKAVDDYLAERIGHGYHVVKDNSVYKMCQERDIHFECCPWSSLLTGSVNPGISKHPIARFAEDEVNFSLNTDDTTITGMTLQNDYDLAGSWGLTEAHVIRANINALRCSFLPQKDKDALMSRLLDSLGVIPERKAK
ncbi:Adenosine deaminase-like protein [Gryllus bimaculatus]|nr:Adenosine deaminase-like protein [Gryllus bimaculatus]